MENVIILKLVLIFVGGMATIGHFLFFRNQIQLLEAILTVCMQGVLLWLVVSCIQTYGYMKGDFPRCAGVTALGLFWSLGGVAWALNVAGKSHTSGTLRRLKLLSIGWMIPGCLLAGMYWGLANDYWIAILLFGPLGAACLLYLHTRYMKRLGEHPLHF